jgi:Cu(I)/Ag(I) efflux system membrane protein CusA/SilA
VIDRVVELAAGHKLAVLTLAAVVALAGAWSMTRLPWDALPEVGDRQIIVQADWDRGAEPIDAQVTAPIAAALNGIPHVKAVRGVSDAGSAFVYVLLDDGASVSEARSRVGQALAAAAPRLPAGVRTRLGPDASSLGWVFQYALVDPGGAHDPRDLRAFQDWTLKPALASLPGVAEVATAGGLTRRYRVDVDPYRLRAHRVSLKSVVEAIESQNGDAGGRVLDAGGAELLVRGIGSLTSADDLEQILVTGNLRVGDLARVTIDAAPRRGVVDLDGAGEVVSGIVVMRQGENALAVIDRVKARLAELAPTLPEGVRVAYAYDRSQLVLRTIRGLRSTILEIMAIVTIVILLFLWHPPSALVPIVTLPLAVLIAFLPLHLLGIGANVMSLAGIAIAVGALVDAAIVVVEQTHKRLEAWDAAGRRDDAPTVVLSAIRQVARPSFYALLVIAVSFLPVLTLEGEAGRLFRPLAYAKSLAMLAAAILAITLDPALRLLLTRTTGPIRREEDHPLLSPLMRAYEPVVRWTLGHKGTVAAIALASTLVAIPAALTLTTELMPPVEEGTILYMPSTAPGISVAEAARLLEATDRTLKSFPEVERVLGKAGRADTATDPAPVSMLETLVVLKPGTAATGRLIDRMDAALKIPGLSNAWTMPVRGRIDMLATGIRTPIGLKVSGRTPQDIEDATARIAHELRAVPGTRAVYAEESGRTGTLDVRWNRHALARAGITLAEAQDAVRYGIGGETVTELIDGRARYPVAVRYAGDPSADPAEIAGLTVTSDDGLRHVPIGELAEVRTDAVPAMLRHENGLLTGYVYVDPGAVDPTAYVRDARPLLAHVALPAGVSYTWSGRYEEWNQTVRRLRVVVPLTLLIVATLLFMSTRSWARTAIVLLAVPFSAVGAVLALWLLDYHVSAAVWVGIIALLGIDAETGIFMLLYLDEAHDRARFEHRMATTADLTRAVVEGAARRLRPKLMTVATMILGLLPIFFSDGPGAGVMRRIAAPMVGGIVSSFLLELLVYPAVYHAWRSRSLRESPRVVEVEGVAS